jgi:hypothetical protein
MMPLGNDFKKHAKWQGSVEEPAAKDFVARKVHTIELNEVQGTNWNAIKCKECLGSHPEAVVRQATINLDSQIWESLSAWEVVQKLSSYKQQSTLIQDFGNPLGIPCLSCTALT